MQSGKQVTPSQWVQGEKNRGTSEAGSSVHLLSQEDISASKSEETAGMTQLLLSHRASCTLSEILFLLPFLNRRFMGKDTT